MRFSFNIPNLGPFADPRLFADHVLGLATLLVLAAIFTALQRGFS